MKIWYEDDEFWESFTPKPINNWKNVKSRWIRFKDNQEREFIVVSSTLFRNRIINIII